MTYILEAPKSAIVDLKTVCRCDFKKMSGVFVPYFTPVSKKMYSVLLDVKVVSNLKSAEMILCKIPYEKTKTHLKDLVRNNQKKKYAVFVRWYQIGSVHFDKTMKGQSYSIVVPYRSKYLYNYKDNKEVSVSAGGVWITNLPCMSKGNVIVYKVD